MGTTAIKGAFLTVAMLFGGLLIGLIAGDLVFRLIPGSSVTDVKLGHALLAAVPALAGFVAGGAAWGVAMGRLAGSAQTRRLAVAGMAGFGPITIALAAILGIFEPAIVGAFDGGQPIHRIFTTLFVPSAFLIAGVSSYAIGRALDSAALARSLFWQVGTAAALAFLAVNLALESLGWVVGAPGAAERATMVTVLALGNVAAALAGGGALGYRLARQESVVDGQFSSSY